MRQRLCHLLERTRAATLPRYLCVHVVGALAEFGFGKASNAITNLHFLFNWENVGNFTRVQDVINVFDKPGWARGKSVCAECDSEI